MLTVLPVGYNANITNINTDRFNTDNTNSDNVECQHQQF